jgi:hypothetical protein
MRYMLLIYGNEAADTAGSSAEQQAMFAAHMAYAADMRAQGVMLAGDPLLPTSAATTVRVQDGKPLITHGPFAETAEQLGGYYIIECPNLDAALDWAAKNPSAAGGSIEVRPLIEM